MNRPPDEPQRARIRLPEAERNALPFVLLLATQDASPTVESTLRQLANLAMRSGISDGMFDALSVSELAELETALTRHPLRPGQFERVCDAIEAATGRRPDPVVLAGALQVMAEAVRQRRLGLMRGEEWGV